MSYVWVASDSSTKNLFSNLMKNVFSLDCLPISPNWIGNSLSIRHVISEIKQVTLSNGEVH